MKILVTAMALVLGAAPAAAQTAPPQHQDHRQHQAGQSGQHQAPHAQHQGAQGEHQGHGMMAGCCQDRNGNGRMDCCENMPEGRECCCEHGEGHGARHGQSGGHQNH